MTINDLIKKLNDMNVSGDMEVRVSAFGGMRHGKTVSNVSLGFDWDQGAVILHTDVPLIIKQDKK